MSKAIPISPCHPECNEGRAGVNGSLKLFGVCSLWLLNPICGNQREKRILRSKKKAFFEVKKIFILPVILSATKEGPG